MTTQGTSNPRARDGTSQRQREPRRITTAGAVPIDARNTLQLLVYLRKLSRLVRFYGEDNDVSEDWSRFFELDVSGVVAETAVFDVDSFRSDFEAALSRYRESNGTDQQAQSRIRDLALDAASKIERWRKAIPQGLKLRTLLDRWVHSGLGEALSGVYDAVPRSVRQRFPDWALAKENVAAVSGTPVSEAALARAGQRFQSAFSGLRERALEHFEETLGTCPEHTPPLALALAVLQLFEYPRAALNQLSLKHFDFYLEEVLRLKKATAIPDRVHVVFQLAKGRSQARIEQGTLLAAGDDATKMPLHYATESELVVSQASIDPTHGLKTIFLNMDSGAVRSLHAAPNADSADGLGADLTGEDRKWLGFGNSKMPWARIGFAIASPVLCLAQGTRNITVTLNLNAATTLNQRDLRKNVHAQITGENGWLDVAVVADEDEDRASDVLSTNLTYQLRIGPEAPPVVAYDPSIHGEDIDTSWPVLRFVLKNPEDAMGRPVPQIVEFVPEGRAYARATLVRYEGRLYEAQSDIPKTKQPPPDHQRWRRIDYCCVYDVFAKMMVDSIDLSVDVEGFRDFTLENETGVLKTTKPFSPFGSVPHAGSSLILGCSEAFSKKLDSLTLTVQWLGLQTNLSEHYQGYKDAGVPLYKEVTAGFYYLSSGEWSEALTVGENDSPSGAVPLIGPIGDKSVRESVYQLKGWHVAQKGRASLGRSARYSPTSRDGFLKIALNEDFLHDKYASVMADWTKSTLVASVRQAFSGASEEGGGDTNIGVAMLDRLEASFAPQSTSPPNPPYTPMLASCVLKYSASDTISDGATRDDIEQRSYRLYQMGPFGHQEVVFAKTPDLPPGVVASHFLMPSFLTARRRDGSVTVAEGSLLIGIRGLEPPAHLSLLIQLAEGSEDPRVDAPKEIGWSYLAAGGWVDFMPTEIIRDTTRNLSSSGIVALAVPKAATSASRLLPTGLHWLRATVAVGTRGLPQLIAIHPHAVSAVFVDRGNDPNHLAQPLPSGKIKQLLTPNASIKAVTQPYASFGGRVAEPAQAFRTRSAERLRHKNRAVTPFDYERLVLDKFPDVYKCRCISHTSGNSEFAPGRVRVVVVPNLRNLNAVDPLRPKFSLARRNAIRDYLVPLASPFVDLDVVNADFEEVALHFRVRFRVGYDEGFYTSELKESIVQYLSPWLHDLGKDLEFGGEIHRSTLLGFVEEQECVDFVSDFVMDQIVNDDVAHDVEVARATSLSAVLVAARDHGIRGGLGSCEDDSEPPKGEPRSTNTSTQSPSASGCYVGNTHTKELHNLNRMTGSCQVAEIAPQRREYFSNQQEALALGYDYCAFCFGRSLSKR